MTLFQNKYVYKTHAWVYNVHIHRVTGWFISGKHVFWGHRHTNVSLLVLHFMPCFTKLHIHTRQKKKNRSCCFYLFLSACNVYAACELQFKKKGKKKRNIMGCKQTNIAWLNKFNAIEQIFDPLTYKHTQWERQRKVYRENSFIFSFNQKCLIEINECWVCRFAQNQLSEFIVCFLVLMQMTFPLYDCARFLTLLIPRIKKKTNE